MLPYATEDDVVLKWLLASDSDTNCHKTDTSLNVAGSVATTGSAGMSRVQRTLVAR